MKNYIGIDLGTTNSAICSYDGVNSPRVWKSPEQNDVTPSAIYIGRRGNRYYGYRAYSRAAIDESNTATLFKRYMGTSYKFDFKDSGVSLSPEECSAEILKTLFGYLPEEIRNDPEVAAVITVPAAFNQVKKESTLEAAKMAGIGRVALMQEPVAAVMSVMRSYQSKSNGIFLIYDLGGGTFDISIAESINGKVNLLTQEGKEMCGGRDWDRKIFDNLVSPWLKKNFVLPENFSVDERYKKLRQIALFDIERAKIELSLKAASESAIIQADELYCKDLNGQEIYLDLPLSRSVLNPLIDGIINETIEISRAAMKKAGLSANDIERLVFVGGPTNYDYLREKVSAELAVRSDTNINPMTAVAEGASIFAESINWSSEHHERKNSNADIAVGTSLNFKYESRASGDKARVLCKVNTPAKLLFEITSDNTGWTSGRLELKDGILLELPLMKNGENIFSVTVYDVNGRKIPVPVPKIIITKTIATVTGIPASHSIAIPALNKLGGVEKLVYLVRKDESLPKKGRVIFKAGQTLKAGTEESLNFNLYEGEIETPCSDNRFIGVYKIPGVDLGVNDIIPTGSEIICDYEISDGGDLLMSASVPCLGTEFERKNFYIHGDAKLDLNDTEKLSDDGQKFIRRIDDISAKIDDERLDKAKAKAEKAESIDSKQINDSEAIQEASNELYEAKKIFAQLYEDRAGEINQVDLDNCVRDFNNIAKYADSSETASFNNLVRTAQRSINEPIFARYLDELQGKIFNILWRQDWFVVESFKYRINRPNDYYDSKRFAELKTRVSKCLANNDIDELRTIIFELVQIAKSDSSSGHEAMVNIIRG